VSVSTHRMTANPSCKNRTACGTIVPLCLHPTIWHNLEDGLAVDVSVGLRSHWTGGSLPNVGTIPCFTSLVLGG
jgi:hypothetical protein